MSVVFFQIKLLFLLPFFLLNCLLSSSESMFSEELLIAKDLARKAGQLILQIRHQGDDLQIQEKIEGVNQIVSHLTIADLRANEVICCGLKDKFPSYGLLSEESSDDSEEDPWWEKTYTWIIDPLDGTEDFVQGRNDFGVHIGLTKNGTPVLGVNYYPVSDTIYWAVKGQGAYRQHAEDPIERILLSEIFSEQPLLPIRSFNALNKAIYEEFLLRELSSTECAQLFKFVGSASLRICTIAEGPYNIYISSGLRGGLWDFLSGEVILHEAGGFISDWKGNPLDYRRKDALVPNGVVVCGNKQIYDKILPVLMKNTNLSSN